MRTDRSRGTHLGDMDDTCGGCDAERRVASFTERDIRLHVGDKTARVAGGGVTGG